MFQSLILYATRRPVARAERRLVDPVVDVALLEDECLREGGADCERDDERDQAVDGRMRRAARALNDGYAAPEHVMRFLLLDGTPREAPRPVDCF